MALLLGEEKNTLIKVAQLVVTVAKVATFILLQQKTFQLLWTSNFNLFLKPKMVKTDTLKPNTGNAEKTCI